MTVAFGAVVATAAALLVPGPPRDRSAPPPAVGPRAVAIAAPAAVPSSTAAPAISPGPSPMLTRRRTTTGVAPCALAAIMVRTYALIGPEVADPPHRYAGNNLSSQSCHLQAGTRQSGLPYQGVFAEFRNYRARSGAVGTIEARINGCMARSLNGKALPSPTPG